MLCLCVGMAVQLQQPQLWLWQVYMAIAVLGMALIALIAPISGAKWLTMPLVMVAAMAVGLGSTGWRATLQASQTLAPELEGRDLRITGHITAMPQASEAGWRFRFEVEQAHSGDEPVQVPPVLDLAWYKPWANDAGTAALPSLQASQRWTMVVRLKAPQGNRNPHGFDWELWLWEQGIGATGSVRAGPKDPPPLLLGSSWRYPLERARQVVRDRILARVATSDSSALAEPSAVATENLQRRLYGVIAALVVGDQQAIAREDWDVFRATGVAHIMSISGLHITLFAWLMGALTGALWRRSASLCLRCPAGTAAALSGLCLATLYALFSGWGVPAQRTVCMLAVLVLLRLGGVRWPWPVVWLLAATVVLLLDPWAMLQAGFWLSFVAVGVLYAGSLGQHEKTVHRSWIAQLRGMAREQGIITLALTPLTLLLFGQVSLVSLLANALAIPWVTLVVTPLSLLGVLWAPLWSWAHLALGMLAQGLSWLADLPWAIISLPQAPLWAGVAGVLGGLLLAMRLPLSLRLIGLPLLLPVLFWQAPRPLPGHFEVLAADVGQGNAVLVQTASHSLLFDAGPRYSVNSDAGHRVLLPLLRALDVSLDVLMLSHRDQDHTGGAVAVLSQQPQAKVMSSIEPGHSLQSLRPMQRCEAGQQWEWDGVRMDVLHPEPSDYDETRKSNALSCVLRISNGQHTLLLTGDIEKPQESRLLQRYPDLRADVLLVPHHGSKTSSSEPFLDAVSPRMAWVQAGYRNRYGHPAPVVMARYTDRDIAVFDSPSCGAARWTSADAQTTSCERSVRPRYWQHRLPGVQPSDLRHTQAIRP